MNSLEILKALADVFSILGIKRRAEIFVKEDAVPLDVTINPEKHLSFGQVEAIRDKWNNLWKGPAEIPLVIEELDIVREDGGAGG